MSHLNCSMFRSTSGRLLPKRRKNVQCTVRPPFALLAKKVRCLLLTALTATLPAAGADYTVTSRRISTADGLAGNTINEIVQDGRGFIWMATNNGLSRYDGYSTVNYTSLASDDAHRLEARIGRIFHDGGRQLLWVGTSTFQNACYDLRQSRFVDWTGRGEQYHRQSKLMLTTRGMVLYGNGSGATWCGSSDGRLWAQSYRKALGTLPSDDVLTVVEDSAHNIWLPTASGIAVIWRERPDRQDKQLVSRRPVIAAATAGHTTYFLGSDGTVEAFDSALQPVRPRGSNAFVIPSVLDRPSRVNACFVWQSRWMLFTPEGTYAMSLSDGTFEKPRQWQVANGLNQGSCHGYHFIGTRQGELWLFPDDGEARMLKLIANAEYTFNKGWLFHVTPDAAGRLFIATYGAGLYVYDPSDGSLSHYSAADRDAIVSSNYLLCAITDGSGSVWIGSETAGAYCLAVDDGKGARYLLPQAEKTGDWCNTVTNISRHGDGNIEIGTRDGGIYALNGTVFEKRGQKGAAVTAQLTDSRGHRWTGTWGDGLYCDGQRYCKADSAKHIPSDIVTDIAEDRHGTVWIATRDGGVLRIPAQAAGGKAALSYRQYLSDDVNGSRINDLELAADGTLWVASNNGISRWNGKDFDLYTPANGRFPSNEVHCLCSGDSLTLWAGTGGGGVVRCLLDGDGRLERTELITTAEGLSNNNATAIVKDRKGYIWVGTEDGVSRINPRNSIVNPYRFSETLLGNVVSDNSTLAASDGRLLMGTAAGLLVISPEELPPQNAAHRATVTDLRINGRSVYGDGGTTGGISITGSSVHENGAAVRLRHDQNSLAFYFSSFEYDWHRQPVFQYYLEGADDGWLASTTLHHAEYSDLEPGTYTFHLRSLDADNEWQEETLLLLTISQPWWNTWWAWLLYLLVAAVAAAYIWRNWRTRFRLHQQMEMERQIGEFRTNLFTNITHEFRTPLAIIQGAVDKLTSDSDNRAALQTARRGTTRLLRLVNQFMEYRKATTGHLKLQVEDGDIVDFVRDIIQDFWPMAHQKSVSLSYVPAERQMTVPFDRQMVESIVYNLVGNAVKYTLEGGSIAVRLRHCDGLLTLSVDDSGPGIGAAQQRELFKPFMHGYVSHGGMGIGLYTAREMAVAHKGSLDYCSGELGGACFTLTLPADATAYDADDYAESSAIARESTAAGQQEQTTEIIREFQGEAFNALTVAIVEDDPDMLEQVSAEVGTYFNTVTYSSGEAAYRGIVEERPALVICDVMLPDRDGYSIVSDLKGDAATANIPVIMLTALEDEGHQIRAYRAGADDYMVKPCNFRLLIARIMQLIRWSRRADGADGGVGPYEPNGSNEPQEAHKAPAAEPLIESRADKVFRDKLAVLTAQHLGDSDFTVDTLAQMMSMGRTKFYGKVKEVTGMSPNKYLQEVRMKKAADLLADGELNISEVSYRVGIQDPSYFNKVFKSFFGVPPSKYGK